VQFRVLGPGDTEALSELFSEIDSTYFRPHPFSSDEAGQIATRGGRDVYAVLEDGGRFVAYGMLRGWDEGYSVPSLGVAVRVGYQRLGLGRSMMNHLHDEARARGARQVRLRVHPDNLRAQQLYQSLGYTYHGVERDELLMVLELRGDDPVDRS
jgi:ribosomal protein S18 acetylase RimI-like enzyme